jgi:hypothetical protein
MPSKAAVMVRAGVVVVGACVWAVVIASPSQKKKSPSRRRGALAAVVLVVDVTAKSRLAGAKSPS